MLNPFPIYVGGPLLVLVTILVALSVLAAVYMAWTIGANDVANAMGTSVGSGALKLRNALIIAAIFEFLGALLVGRHVTETVSEGIIDPAIFLGAREILITGMLCVLIGSALWVTFATYYGLPVSTGHALIGGIMGFAVGTVILGKLEFSEIQFDTVGNIALSWVISPIAGGVISYLLFRFIIMTIHHSRCPSHRARLLVPFFTGTVMFILAISILYKGLSAMSLDPDLVESLAMAGMLAAVVTLASFLYLNYLSGKRKETGFDHVEKLFSGLLVMTACYIAFAHGASDVSHAIGPAVAVFQVADLPFDLSQSSIMLFFLALGAIGIVIGLSTWGHRVMATMGEKIAAITPAQGFSATFGGATTVLVCASMGLPISTSQVLVGSVVGVALVQGRNKVNLKMFRKIVISWVLTLPVAAVLVLVLFLVTYAALF